MCANDVAGPLNAARVAHVLGALVAVYLPSFNFILLPQTPPGLNIHNSINTFTLITLTQIRQAHNITQSLNSQRNHVELLLRGH